MTVRVKWDLYGSTRRYAVLGGTEKRLDRVVRRCRIDGIRSDSHGLDQATDALITGSEDVWGNPYNVPKRWVEATRWGPTRAWGTVVHDRGGQGGGTTLVRDTRVRYEWRQCYRRPNSFDNVNGWPNGRMISDNGKLDITNPVYDPLKQASDFVFIMQPLPVSTVILRSVLTFDPWTQVAGYVGKVNSGSTSYAGHVFPSYSIRFDGADIQSLLVDNLPRWRVAYEFTFVAGAHFAEYPIRKDDVESPTGIRWTTEYLIQYPSADFSHIPVNG